MFNFLALRMQILKLNTIDSTNNFIKKEIPKGLRDNTIVISESQTNGRGQAKKKWVSEPNKNLTFSIYKHNFINAKELFDINKTISVAIAKNLIQLGLKNVSIKWPNDVFVNEKKIAGILIETSLTRHIVKDLIIGVGLNINQINFDSSINATSVALELKEQCLNIYFTTLITQITEHLNLFKKKTKFPAVIEFYSSHLYKKNIFHTFKVCSKSLYGKIINVDNLGNLVIKTQNGNLHLFKNLEIDF